jgi:uncharacterized membrane protein YeaQ/YmgE (transglycosylase-associated protein family)
MPLEDFIKRATATPAETTPYQESSVGTRSLLSPPVDAMVEAAKGIREAAREIGEPPAKPAGIERDRGTHHTGEELAKPGVPPVGGQEGQESQEPHLTAEPRKTPPVEAVPRRSARPGSGRGASIASGVLLGALSGATIGGAWYGARQMLGADAVEVLTAPLPSWRMLDILPAEYTGIVLTAVLGLIAGLLAAFTTRASGRVGLASGVIWSLFIGAVVGASWVLSSGYEMGFSVLSLGLNWPRDLLAAGLLTVAFSRLFRRSPR